MALKITCPVLTLGSYTIVDEADELLHGDWDEDMSKIMAGGGKCSSPFCENVD